MLGAQNDGYSQHHDETRAQQLPAIRMSLGKFRLFGNRRVGSKKNTERKTPRIQKAFSASSACIGSGSRNGIMIIRMTQDMSNRGVRYAQNDRGPGEQPSGGILHSPQMAEPISS